MIPLIADNKELKEVKKDILNEIELIFSEKDEAISFKIGTMIELPRAAILAKEIAKEAEFFSFGTNDLTQMTFGLSRDDSGRFLPDYLGKKIFTKDPFVSLDQKGVGFLIAHGVKEGRKGNPNIHFGICGEHGGDPQSIQFCHHIGLDYVSCSPFRIPIARLAAAQAVLND
jgi:pyruvate,orthophosphate dikinase